MIGGYMQVQQAQHIIVDTVKESIPLKIVLVCIPIIIAFILSKLFSNKKDKCKCAQKPKKNC